MTPGDREDAARHYLPLAMSVAWRYRFPHLQDEIESAAKFGLFQALVKFEPGRGMTLSAMILSYAHNRIKDALRGEGRRLKRYAPVGLLFELPGSDASVRDVDAIDAADHVEAILSRVPDGHPRKRLLERIARDGLTRNELAVEIDRHKTTASHHTKAARDLAASITLK